MSQGQVEDRANKWKSKAIARGAENKRLARRVKELTQSRDRWKGKCLSLQNPWGKSSCLEGKAFGHQYPLCLVLLMVMLQKYGSMSLRGCRHCVACLGLVGLSFRVPSHNSIRNWACKCGYFRVHSREGRNSPYVLYVDESIVFGSEKILLVLGVPADGIPTGRSVSHADTEVLYVGMGNSWTGEGIAIELAKINAVTPISYIVSDEGANLKSAYKQGNYTHIEDCTHILSNILKHAYEGNAQFEAFRSLVGKARQAFYLSKENSSFLPPSLRGKLRFINIFPCVDWAVGILKSWQGLPCKVQETLSFLQDEKSFIEELGEHQFIFTEVCTILKNESFSAASKCKIEQALIGFGKSESTKRIAEKVIAYLDRISVKYDSLKLESGLCSSDIIESFFGKFKQKINPSNKNQLSEFVLTIANFGKDFGCQEVKNALEKVKVQDLKNYKMKMKNGTKK